jgi:hypothetical protein
MLQLIWDNASTYMAIIAIIELISLIPLYRGKEITGGLIMLCAAALLVLPAVLMRIQ